jgi:hypothetical protein
MSGRNRKEGMGRVGDVCDSGAGWYRVVNRAVYGVGPTVR